MIIECKEMSVALNTKVLEQVLRYNVALQVPYLVITNGSYCYAFEIADGHMKAIDKLP